eukprot:GSChrysophyteH1.ASY1.ANO1.2357.1 assembled CDS
MFRDDSDTRALYKEFTNITSKEFADCQERYTLRVVYNILSNPLKGKEDQLQAINAHFGVSASIAKRKEAVGFLRPLTQKLKASATYIPHRRTRPDLLSIYKNAAQLQFHKPDSSTQDKYFRKAPSRQIDAWQPAAQSTSTSVDFERDSETGVEKVSPIDASTGTRKGAGSHYGEGDSQWLLGLCRDFTSSHVHEFPALRLAEELHKICVDSRNNSARLENSLIELLGFDGVEFMMEVVSNRDRIAEAELGSSKVWDHVDNDIDDDAKIAHELSMMNMSYDQQDDSVDMESMSANQRRKLVQKQEYLTEERALGLEKFKPRTIEDRWLDGLAPEGTTESRGPQKLGLPAGTKREYGQGWEEVHIPAAKKKEQMKPEDHVDISSLESWAQKAFEGTKCLNTIQTTVYKTAYQSTENMLVCAPTGAGKTNIAMLTFLQLLKQNIEAGELNKEAVKAIYPLGLVVKEYTGDMQLTKAEIIESQMLVTTPEKYDVITRKGGDGSLMTMQVRIVGLSATLPNYKDVAKFLGVNNKSCYFFGPEYRPVPLDQTFIGLTEKSRVKLKNQMAEHAYHKMVSALERGKQVMIFVHSRKETSGTAQQLQELVAKYNTSALLDNSQHENYNVWKRAVDRSRSKEVQNLFAAGMGMHHAGMLRADRTLTEQLFESGMIKLLCCTATLAWGVNLPAHTVIIKGTELYDPERGGFVDLSILDVLQIFGRAGRPQYAETGHAILITPHKSLNNYLGMLGQQAPIESNFIKALADHLNAEVVNGTVSNIAEASTWISYTFLFIRMRANPLAYGMTQEDIWEDPQLNNKRVQLVKDAATILDQNLMLRYDKECLHALCSASEFDQLKVRPEETAELERLKKAVPMKTKSIDDTAGKVSVLLQQYCRQERVESFTLQSDTNYIAQNAGHVIHRIETTNSTPERIIEMDPTAIGVIIHNQKAAKQVLRLANRLPHLYIDATVKPITRGILRIVLEVYIDFQWDTNYHGFAEPFHIWIEDGENETIYHSEFFLAKKKQHDKRMPPHTPLLDIHPVPTSALCNRIFESLYKSFTHFNPVQSQTFHTLYHSDKNVLIGAPTGSGKTITAELAILHLLKTRPESKAIYVAPMKALARERLYDWQRKFGKRGFELNVLELTGDASPDARALQYVRQVELVILDEVHLLGVDRGPVLEMIVSRMRFIAAQMNRNVRFVGLSTALANPRDLADWLGIDEVGVQTRLTALDLIAYCAADLDKPKRDGALRDTIAFGVGIHHAGLDNYDRLTVEKLFLSNKIQGTEFYDGKINRYVDMPVTDVDHNSMIAPLQSSWLMSRRKTSIKKSSLHNYLHDHLNAEIANGTLHNLEDCIEFLTWTTHLIDMIKTVVFDLQAGKCLDCFDDEGKTIQSENDRDEPTRLGTISSYYYLHYKTVGHFENKIQELELGDWSSAETASEDLVKELTWCICQSSEFSELPVRHNEEGLNKELAKDLPWSVIQNERLPISDYINDTKSVLDQVPRVLGALLEVAVMKENHYVIESLSVLSQMISQGCMFGESDLMQLPYSSQNVVSYLEHHHQLIHLNQLKSQKPLYSESSDLSYTNITLRVEVQDQCTQTGGARQLRNGRHHKPKQAGWWLVVTYEKKGSQMKPALGAFKRVPFLTRLIDVTIEKVPVNTELHFKIQLLSDTYHKGGTSGIISINISRNCTNRN